MRGRIPRICYGSTMTTTATMTARERDNRDQRGRASVRQFVRHAAVAVDALHDIV